MEERAEVSTDHHGVPVPIVTTPHITTQHTSHNTAAEDAAENQVIGDWFPYVFHLDFFGGIASVSIILESLGIERLATFAWDIDQVCIDIAAKHFPDTSHRGDLRYDDMQDIAKQIKELTDEFVRVAPARDTYIPPVFITIAAPCPDFSPIRGSKSPGRKGELGKLFDQCCDQIDILEQHLENKVDILAESLHMTNKDAAHFDKRLKCKHYYGDPRHGGCISRPRL